MKFFIGLRNFTAFHITALALLFAGALTVFAQEIVPPTSDDITAFLTAIGGWKTLGTMGGVALAVQGIMLLLRSSAGSMLGKVRLSVLTGLTLVAGVISLKITGLDWSAALVHSSTLVSAQVFINQVWKQIHKET